MSDSLRPYINARIESRLKSIKRLLKLTLPYDMRDDFDEKSYIAGGAIFSLYHNETPRDYDFFLTDDAFAKKLRDFFIKSMEVEVDKDGILIGRIKEESLRLEGYYRIVVTDNAVSIDRDFQIITRWVGEPEEVLGEFDFLHNQFYFKDNKLQGVAPWSCLQKKVLKYNKKRARDICGTIMRVKKFVERGFTITNSEMAGMLLNLKEVGFNNREIEILNSAIEEKLSFGS